jgi:hypothetical protein
MTFIEQWLTGREAVQPVDSGVALPLVQASVATSPGGEIASSHRRSMVVQKEIVDFTQMIPQ